MEKWLLCPFAGVSANSVRGHHAVRYLQVSHVSGIVLYYGQCHSFSMLVSEITVGWWKMHVPYYVYILFATLESA